MPRFHQLRTLPHTVPTLFDIVLDVECYPQFLPWCLKASVSDKTDDSLSGMLLVGNAIISTSFTSLVHFDRTTGLISMQARSPYFSRFESRWLITPSPRSDAQRTSDSAAACVDFLIDFEIRNLPFKPLFEVLFHQATRRMVEAFEERATTLARRSPSLAAAQLGLNRTQ